MKSRDIIHKLMIIGIISLFFGLLPPSYTADNNLNLNYANFQDTNLNGRILFTPEYSTKTYLINYDGDIINTWNCENLQGLAVYMLENGDILRSDFPYLNPRFMQGGITGRVAKYDWEGTRKWEFIYSNSQHCLHHDIEPLPNGNVLMITWEYKSNQEAIKQGRDPDSLSSGLWPDSIIEVNPSSESGEIVWRWNSWDHLVQDFDSSKLNYGFVHNNPQLININFASGNRDWLHTNSIDYNEEFDQIILSVHNFNEIWVIDHSTTTEEAAGHSGGNSGKGGDLLYRWGNPQTYNRGNENDRILLQQHDARWIEPGYPGEGNILIFNNGKYYPGCPDSTILEIVPPIDLNGHYYMESGSTYGPEEPIWTYTANFFAFLMSGAQRLPNGNTLFCNGPRGEFFEINNEKEIIWEYKNPYPTPFNNNVFKIQHYPVFKADLDCDGSLNWKNIKCGETISGEFTIKNMGGPGSLLNWEIKSYPDWGTWTFNKESGVNLTPADGYVTIQISVIAPEEKSGYEGYIKVVNQDDPEDTDVIPVILKTPRNRPIQTTHILKFFKSIPNKFPLLRYVFKL